MVHFQESELGQKRGNESKITEKKQISANKAEKQIEFYMFQTCNNVV